MSLTRLVREGSGEELLVLLHGLGSNEGDLFGLASEIPSRFTVVSLRAPRDYGFGGYAWFEIGFDADGMTIDTAQAQESVELVCSELSALREEFAPTRVTLAGFSQGAMISAGVLSAEPNLVDSTWLMSGAWLPCFDVADLSGKQVLVQHGVQDQVVPHRMGEHLAGILTEQLANVKFLSYQMAHEVSHESLNDARAFLLGSE